MPKLKNKFPKLCRDGKQAYSWHNGKRIYHGVYGTPEAQKSYNRFIAGLAENTDRPLRDDGETGDTFVSELAARFLRYVEPRLDKTEFQHFKRAVGYLVEFHGDFNVNEFSPKKLKVCRSRMVKAGTLCRSQVNKQIGRIIRIFAWGVEEELVQPNIVAALREVKNLQQGEKGTFDNPPRQEVADEVVSGKVRDFRQGPVFSFCSRFSREFPGSRPCGVRKRDSARTDRTRDGNCLPRPLP